MAKYLLLKKWSHLELVSAIERAMPYIMGNSGLAYQVVHRKCDSIGQTEIFEELRKKVTIKNDLSTIARREPQLQPLDESSLMKRRRVIETRKEEIEN